MSETVPGIYKKLHAIMSEANYIQKDKENPHFNYKYASEAAIKEKLHGLFVKHKVLPVFSAANQQSVEIGRTEKGKATFRTTLDLTYRFVDIEDGSSVEGSMSGAGVDSEDKGTYKAITGALKYCLTSQFVIPTGDDPENDNGERDRKLETKAPNREKTSTTIGPARPAAPAPFEPKPNDLKAKSVGELLKIINVDYLKDDTEFNFVNETKIRFDKYKDRIKMSEKQLNWLVKIAQSQAPEESIVNGNGLDPDEYTA